MSPTVNTKPNRVTFCIIELSPRSRSGDSAQEFGISTAFETSDEFSLVLVRDCFVCAKPATVGNAVQLSGLRIEERVAT